MPPSTPAYTSRFPPASYSLDRPAAASSKQYDDDDDDIDGDDDADEATGRNGS
jgi:hypothetical protein